jgi:hypothetical protein
VAATDVGMASGGAGWPQRLTEEDTMIQRPAIAAALAVQRRTAGWPSRDRPAYHGRGITLFNTEVGGTEDRHDC